MTKKTAIAGFPRIGENRELKKVLERYWSGAGSVDELEKTASEIRKKNWLFQKEKGIDLISSNDFSLYDNMLDTAIMLNAVPQRFMAIRDKTERYFAMARGTRDAPAMEMTKWFNTNYHYIVPELEESISFHPNAGKITAEYHEAASIGIKTKINIIGPLTFLGLSKTTDGKDPYHYRKQVLSVYKELMHELSQLDTEVYVQMDEPILVKNPSQPLLDLLNTAYWDLPVISNKLKVIVNTYFSPSVEATKVLAVTPVWGIGLDFVYGEKNLEALACLNNKMLVAGVVDGRNIWLNDMDKTLGLLKRIAHIVGKEYVIVSTSCSLLHVPYSLSSEPESSVKKWFAFCCEKVEEVSCLGRVFHADKILPDDKRLLVERRKILKMKKHSPLIYNPDVRKELQKVSKTERSGDSVSRLDAQKNLFNLPVLPTTTIGSFPQTPALRKIRKEFRDGLIPADRYEESIKAYIGECLAFQEEIGLDVLVHGEPERNDMVEYFGELLTGFHFTANGWVQSYGSRCVKPPILYGDVSRPEPLTVKWITFAQGRTKKIVKGMLTGPVTILNWSFVRNDIPRQDAACQLALALRAEIADLQSAGIKIIQVDEAAFKEGYPLRREDIPAYEAWAVAGFKLAVSLALKTTQIHTHMCYSNFDDIFRTIEALDADVITIETARSGNRLLEVFHKSGYKNEIGPGVYDIHSPRIPSPVEFEQQIRARLEVVSPGKIWINPDCGLKTRSWDEVRPALRNMVAAAKKLRQSYM